MQIAGAENPIVRTYLDRTPGSRSWAQRAARSMPGGNTRTTTFCPPYPVMFVRGEGPVVVDIDGNRYADLHFNGLSIIHGHGFAPVLDAIARVAPGGTAWSGGSKGQVEFAEALTSRIPGAWQARFTNSGSEACMLAAAVARKVTGRPYILKFVNAYHGSYPDLEAGLYGRGELDGHTLLAAFNDLESCAAALERHKGQIAAIIFEPVMFTGRVVVAEPGFLNSLEALAQANGALTILDDCLMLRLAPGGSVEKFDLDPDLIALGKFVGGGTPLGAVLGRPEIMKALDPRESGSLFHGGSFNGNVLGCAAGLAALIHLDGEGIGRMDSLCARLRQALKDAAAGTRFEVEISGMGSVGGIAFVDDQTRHEDNPSGMGLSALFHLACLNEGVSMGTGGLFALATMVDDAVLDGAIAGMTAALRTLESSVE